MQKIGNPDRNEKGKWEMIGNCSRSVYIVTELSFKKGEEPDLFVHGAFWKLEMARKYLRSVYERHKYEWVGSEFSECKESIISKDEIVAWAGDIDFPDIKYVFRIDRVRVDLLTDRMWELKGDYIPMDIKEHEK